jgi:bile acid:Na+ symporter, BASS family
MVAIGNFFAVLLRIVTPIFAISSMALVGVKNNPRDIIAPLRNWRLVAAALIASFGLVPPLAWGVSRLLSLAKPFEIGLMLVAVSSGAPVIVLFVQSAGGNLALTGTMIVLLAVATVIYMPLVLPLALAGEVNVHTATVAMTLVWTMLLPVVIAAGIRVWSRELAQRWAPILAFVSMMSLWLSVVSTVLADVRGMLEIFGKGAILAGLLVTVGSFWFGYLLGGRDQERRTVLGFATGQRNIAASMVVATQDFGGDRDVAAMVVVTSLVAMAILFPMAFVLRKRANGRLDERSRLPR